MVRTLRWLFVLLPCMPGLTLLAAAFVLMAVSPAPDLTPETDNLLRVRQLGIAGSVVLMAGMMIGWYVAWRISHPRPEPTEDGGPPPVE